MQNMCITPVTPIAMPVAESFVIGRFLAQYLRNVAFSAENDGCQLSLIKPKFVVGSDFNLEARLVCNKAFKLYNVGFKIGNDTPPHRFTNFERINSVEYRFRYKRTYPVNLKDAGIRVQAIGKKYPLPDLLCEEQYLIVHDRPVIITKEIRNETAHRGQKVTKVIYVRERSPVGWSKDAVRLIEWQGPTAEGLEMDANVTVSPTKVPGIFEVAIEFVAQKSTLLEVVIRSYNFTEKSPIFGLEVTPDDDKSCILKICLTAIFAFVLGFVADIVRHCNCRFDGTQCQPPSHREESSAAGEDMESKEFVPPSSINIEGTVTCSRL